MRHRKHSVYDRKRLASYILRAIRATFDLTQEQLAEQLGVSFTTVNRWEGGGIKP